MNPSESPERTLAAAVAAEALLDGAEAHERWASRWNAITFILTSGLGWSVTWWLVHGCSSIGWGIAAIVMLALFGFGELFRSAHKKIRDQMLDEAQAHLREAQKSRGGGPLKG